MKGRKMQTTLSHRLSMIPRLTASSEKVERLVRDYAGWELLEVDKSAGEILICKPCTAEWAYTKSKHLLILYGEAATVWQCNRALALDCIITTP
jgi:hypothetical protein